MYTFEINQKRDEMTVFKNGKPVYKAGYHKALDADPRKKADAQEDCVRRLETQLIY